MAVSKVSVTAGVGTEVATYDFSESALTKQLQRVVINNSSGTEVDFSGTNTVTGSGTAGTPAAARDYTTDEIYSGGSWTLKVDAATIGSNAAALPAATAMSVGSNRAATSFLDDYVRSLTVVG